jgi:hypothetical protein
MLKPLKFAVSIAIFLATLSLVTPMLSVAPGTRRMIEWVLAGSMLIEMAAILMQALRGTTSHYNLRSGFDRTVLIVMVVAVVAVTVAMAGVAVVATIRPLRQDGHPLPAVSATAWRVGLWMFQLAAFSGFAMGGRGQHSVGAVDGGPGLPGLNWSVQHGDLRISHFLALHAVQILPLVAAGARTAGLAERERWGAVLTAIAIQGFVIVWTLVRAFSGRTPW